MADLLIKERLFVAAPIPARARDELARRLPDVIPGRRVPPDKWHFTLRFLGGTTPERRDRLIAELGKVEFHGPFRIELGGLGAFPRPQGANVLWIGVTSGAEMLAHLAKSVETAAEAAGFDAETRPFRSHLTLSRLDRPTDVSRLIEIVPAMKLVVDIREVVLFRSHLGRGGARHERVVAFR